MKVSYFLNWRRTWRVGTFVALAFSIGGPGYGADLAGIKASLSGPAGTATLTAELVSPKKLSLRVDPKSETKPISIFVELPDSGPNAWPLADVEARDGGGKALRVQRAGDEWSKLLVPLPPGVTNCFVQAVEPPGGWPKPTTDKERAIQDTASGWRLRIAKWHDGRVAALSIRFDDSHPTHLTKAVPILREYGLRGTFMINPGGPEPGSRRIPEFAQHRAEWEALARQGDHEFANHSAHHRGGFGDEDMEAEIGEAAQAIWALTPGRSKLMALNLGGGTRWDTTKTLRHYLDKYHQFDALGNSTGMDDSYGGRVENFRRILEQHIQRGLWCRVHYHYIGEGLSSSEANFRAALDIAKERAANLWIAGMADIHKYQTERDSAKLTLIKSDAHRLSFRLSCKTERELYDQPLTIEAVPPASWNLESIVIKDPQESPMATKPGKMDGATVLRFDVPPRDADWSINGSK